MPVHIEVRLVRLTPGFEQRRRGFQKRHAQLMRAGRYGKAQLQCLVHTLIVLVWWWRYREQPHSLPIQEQLQLL